MESSVDKSALLSLKAEDKYDDEDEAQELVSSSDFDGTADDFVNPPMDDCASEPGKNVAVNQSYDSDDMDDDNLLTSDLNDKQISSPIEPAPSTVDGGMHGRSAAFNDDDDFSDEDLLTD